MKARTRKPNGMSLVEMLATIFIMGIVGAGITEICVTQNVVAFRTYNKVEALTNARRVASFIERDIHNARFVGDEFGANPSQFPGGIPQISTKPVAFGFNPYTNASTDDPRITGFLGFPSSGQNISWQPPYSLDSQTLILQIPIFTTDKTGGIAGLPTLSLATNAWNVDTVVYKVVADGNNRGTGQFILQKAVFPGEHLNSGYTAPPPGASNNPQTILTGIVGPVDPTATVDSIAGTPPPKVFSYFTKQYPIYASNGGSILAFPLSAYDPGNINGVAIDLEVFSNAFSRRTDLSGKSTAFRTEVYLRGNYWSP